MQCVFFTLQSPSEKKECLGLTAASCFLKQTKLLMIVNKESEALYLSQLLWGYPQEAVLPHGIGNAPTVDPLFITWNQQSNWNQAEICFNLQSSPLTPRPPCRVIVEFWDNSSAEKEARSREHQEFYERAGHSIELHRWQPHLRLDKLLTLPKAHG